MKIIFLMFSISFFSNSYAAIFSIKGRVILNDSAKIFDQKISPINNEQTTVYSKDGTLRMVLSQVEQTQDTNRPLLVGHLYHQDPKYPQNVKIGTISVKPQEGKEIILEEMDTNGNLIEFTIGQQGI